MGGSGEYREPQELLTLGHTHKQTNKQEETSDAKLSNHSGIGKYECFEVGLRESFKQERRKKKGTQTNE